MTNARVEYNTWLSYDVDNKIWRCIMKAHKYWSIGAIVTMVGTFYTAAGPDEEPFVKPGQSVHAGDVIGIIEAMKLMNEVTADCDGTVKEVAAENGAMVEYGQPLVILN